MLLAWRAEREQRKSTGAAAAPEDASRRLTVGATPAAGARAAARRPAVDAKHPPATPAAPSGKENSSGPNAAMASVQRQTRPLGVPKTAVTPASTQQLPVTVTPAPTSAREGSPSRGRPPLRATPSPPASMMAPASAATPPLPLAAADMPTTPTVSLVAANAGLAVLQSQLDAARGELAASQAAAVALEQQLEQARAAAVADRSAADELMKRMEALAVEKQDLEARRPECHCRTCIFFHLNRTSRLTHLQAF